MIGKRYKFKPLKSEIYGTNRAMQALAMMIDGVFTVTKVATNDFGSLRGKGATEIKIEGGRVLNHKSREVEKCFACGVWCLITENQLDKFCDEVVEEKEALELEPPKEVQANDQWIVMTLNTDGGARNYIHCPSQGEAIKVAKSQKLNAILSVKVYVLAPVAEITLDVNVVNL